MKIPGRGMWFMLVLAACFLGSFLWNARSTQAAVKDVQVINGNTSELTVTIGDTGHIQPVADTLMTDASGVPVTVARWEYDSYQEEIVRVDPNGYYEALSYGKTTICVYGYTEFGVLVFRGSCDVTVCVDMTNVTLETDQLTGYVAGYDSYTGKIRINSSVLLSGENSVMTYQSDEPDMSVSCELINSELSITAYGEGDTKLTVVINGKEFLISFKVIRLEMSKTSLVASRGKKTKLRIRGTGEKAKWTSSNTRVVKVSGDGTIRCRKTGNAVITAQIGEIKVGCAVSVIPTKLLRVVNMAKKIGANWKYSQAKRMQKGYYDCSSLVWRCYKKMGKTFGDPHYAPVAANIAKWCAGRKKMITRSYTWNHVQKMKLRPGDLIFKTGQKNGRYKGIYHVEMFVGYTLTGFDSSGKAVLSELWAARSEGYGGGGYPVARP